MLDYDKIDELTEKLQSGVNKVDLSKIKPKEEKKKPKYDYRKYHKKPMNHPDNRKTI